MHEKQGVSGAWYRIDRLLIVLILVGLYKPKPLPGIPGINISDFQDHGTEI